MDCYDVNERTNDMPYGAEYAKSGRSSCKKCRGYIGEGYLRLSAREPSRFFDGVQDNWFHLDCFFHKLGRGAINERSIRGLENLRWEDQEKLRERIQEVDRGGSSSPTSNKRKPHYRQVKVQHSKSKRGKCSKCRESFNAKEVKFGVKSAWFHQKCSVDEEEYEGAVTDMQGFDELTDEAKEALKQSLGNKIIPQPDTMTTSAGPNAEEGPGRMPNESAAAHNTSAENLDSKDSDSDEEVPTIKKFCFTKPAAKPTETLKDKLKKQTDIMWGIREQFQQAKFGKQNMIELLRFNGQLNEVMEKKTEEQLLEHLVDCICFGKPVQCDRCDTGLLIFSITLRTYACIGYISEFTRCINVDPNPPRTIFMIPKSMDKRFPFLANVPFNALSQRVYPGENEDVVKRRDSSYFKNLGSRGATERYTESVKQGIDENGISKKIIKFGTAVDGEFHAAAECHVYKDEEGVLYSAALHMTDVLSNINSYYKMQLLKDDTQDIFYVFRSWGRVGTNVGGLSSDRYWSVQPAVNQFSEIFFEKTGNKWENKKYFKKRPGRFGYVETDYTELENVKETTIIPGSTTKLHRSVKELILMISDVKNLNKQAANELQLDTTRMPLGKLSKQQITTAYTVLTDVQKLLADGAPVAAILDATNKFYTLIPHDFGMKNADILDNTDIIKKKCEMLDALIGFQFAYDFLRRGENEPDAELRDPVDITYGNLYCNMEYVDPQSIDYALIQKYLENSHGETHSHYKMSLIDVIKLKRSGEEEKFMRDLGNRKLLWHGSGIGNFVGILSKGLRIAPPEAPVSGYMFGKGIYFADMVSKSANYCRVDRGEGLLLLCDVALGNVKEEYHAGAKGPPKGYNSIKGVGRIRPVDDVYQHPDGYTIALNGQAKDADPNVPNANYSLIYNEYIVYTLDQCVLRYIVRVKFA